MNIGIFSIREQFSYDLLKKINQKNVKGVRAEFAIVGETRFLEKSPYRVIIDRISSYVDYFKTYFKNASLTGTYVINNPYGIERVDRLYNSMYARKLGLSTPRMVCLPTRQYHPDCDESDLRNLKYPLDWEDICDFIGFPAMLKPYKSHGFRDIYKVNSIDELIQCYNGTGRQVMIMQEFIPYDFYVKTFVVGKEKCFTLKYNPKTREYVHVSKSTESLPLDKVVESAIVISKELDIDFNTVEFALKDGVPYAVDLFNPHPDCRLEALTEESYNWCLDNLSELAINKAQSSDKNNIKLPSV